VTKGLFLVFLFLSPLSLSAASLREEALRETQSLDKKAYRKSIQASEAQQAQVASFLKLQDPTPELRNRPWFWTFAFKMQSLQPLGTGKVVDLSYALESYGPSVMPSAEFGFVLPVLEAKHLSWGTGLAAHAGYMTQKTDLVTPSGFRYKDTRLTTTLASLVWTQRLKFKGLPKLGFLLNPEFGFVNYTQTSQASSMANFTQQNNYWGAGAGMEYFFTPKFAVLAQYTHRRASTEKETLSNIQKNSFEVGTQVTW